MSILGYVSALLHMILSGQGYGQSQSSQSSASSQSPAKTTPTAATEPAAPAPQTEGLGQVGLAVESMLSGQSGAESGTNALPNAQTETSDTTAALAGAQQNAASSAAQTNASQSKNTAGQGSSAAQAGLENAQSHVTNANAQSVLEALLGRLVEAGAATQDGNDTVIDLSSLFDADSGATESDARRLAEMRVDANRREAILESIATAANPVDSVAAGVSEMSRGRDAMEALMSQMTGMSVTQGAYSTFSLAVVGHEAQRGHSIRLTL
ncbi:hypothetical protein C8J27_102191 [Rhodobacter aestuarii]|uniref:Uncharacterized protein n=1 Tax=Rhodobacter aestuarii TaxID=453582 RepID=A0A1N7NDW2_9RHOB|nr:hypothetical protein [Rhodobacter aestuarii]PTV96397.1 hypothetical protein C8J27_102191 [Rhodobacter aestuarii]SIS96389.1 hypothetical protein SAMN05421580_107191 [Rhodobacter aestuarii]